MADKRPLFAVLIGLAGFLAVVASSGTIGITWDEAIYMRSARQYMNWFGLARLSPAEAFRASVLTDYWGPAFAHADGRGRIEDIHPPLVKLVAGLLWRAGRGVVGDLVAFRLFPAICFGLLLATLSRWVSEIGGLAAGLATVLCLVLMPRFFAYANLLALDTPLASISVTATYVYWKTVARPGLRWAFPFGVLWGLAIAAKNGGVLLLVGVGLWTLLYCRTWLHLTRLALSGAVAVCVFVALWPWLYHDTLWRLLQYVDAAYLGHSTLLGMSSYYLGRLHSMTPWHYPLVITLAVIPLVILIVIAVGTVASLSSSKQSSAAWLFVLAALGPMLPFLLTLSPGYDGERLFLSSFPFLAALGGLGLVRLRDVVWAGLWRYAPRLVAHRRGAVLRGGLMAALLILVAVLPLASIISLHPYELAYYGEAVGGVRGATRLGLETTFWADSYLGVLDYLNQNARSGAIVWADAYRVLWAYQEIGRLRSDIVIPGIDTPQPVGDFAIVQARQSRYSPAVLGLMRSRESEFAITVDGVPLVMVYRLP